MPDPAAYYEHALGLNGEPLMCRDWNVSRASQATHSPYPCDWTGSLQEKAAEPPVQATTPSLISFVGGLIAKAVLAAKHDTWGHVFQGIEEPCGCEPHQKLFAIFRDRTREAEFKGWTECLRMIRDSVEGYPNAGGDIEIMTAIQNIAQEAAHAEDEAILAICYEPSTQYKFSCPQWLQWLRNKVIARMNTRTPKGTK